MLRLKRIHHLIRYFVIIGMISFAGYVMHWHDSTFLLLNGPAIFLAYEAKRLAFLFFPHIPKTETIQLYAFLLPVIVFYFSFSGFLFKQLWNERGLVRTICFLAFLVFLVYIHWATWNHLTGYVIPNA